MTTNNKTTTKRPSLQITRKLNVLGLSAIISLFFSCKQDFTYEQYRIIDKTMWDKNKEYYFTFNIDDPSKTYDVSLQIRNNNKYPYQNIWLFLQEEKPIGGIERDTIEGMLADDFGKWYGHGISLYEMSFPIKTGYRFPHKGQYTFAVKQAMRDSCIIGIQEIGLQVQESSFLP